MSAFVHPFKAVSTTTPGIVDTDGTRGGVHGTPGPLS